MGKFIEVHQDGVPSLLNLDYIGWISEQLGSGIIYTSGTNGSFVEVDESYGDLRLLIAAAQGGIPMERSGMY